MSVDFSVLSYQPRLDVILYHECCKGEDKLQVTKASRRLTGAVERKADVDVLTVLMVELEKVYDDFLCDR